MGTPKLPEGAVFDALLTECRQKKHLIENQLPKSGQLEAYRQIVSNTMSNAVVKTYAESLVAELINAILCFKPREARTPTDPVTRALRTIHKHMNGQQLDAFSAFKGTVLPTETVSSATSLDDMRNTYMQALEDQRSATARAAAAGGLHSGENSLIRSARLEIAGA